ncbi:MAG: hypothetical protein ACK51V_01205 [bacterium]|jgi:hypothetical protein|nr:hypothetical protein [Betaproteobacteria bacterium]
MSQIVYEAGNGEPCVSQYAIVLKKYETGVLNEALVIFTNVGTPIAHGTAHNYLMNAVVKRELEGIRLDCIRFFAAYLVVPWAGLLLEEWLFDTKAIEPKRSLLRASRLLGIAYFATKRNYIPVNEFRAAGEDYRVEFTYAETVSDQKVELRAALLAGAEQAKANLIREYTK